MSAESPARIEQIQIKSTSLHRIEHLNTSVYAGAGARQSRRSATLAESSFQKGNAASPARMAYSI